MPGRTEAARTRPGRAAVLLAVAAVAALLLGATPPSDKLDVLLVTVDTLRADALGSYGSRRAETPWMDRLAAAGVRFAEARAHNVLTLPSHANILAGLHPHEHGVRDNSGFRFPAEPATLSTLLRANGYRTAAFVSAFPLDSRFGLDRGFDLYEDSFVDATNRPAFLEQERPGVETVALARDWLAAADGRPSFAWVHLYEPHFPYQPPEPFASRFRDAPYDGDVAAADAALGPLLEPILAAGEAGRTVVVLTSDHGEALGEHGEATHGIFAYESVLRVPLVVYHPRRLSPRVVVSPARHVDLLPTVLDLLGLPAPPGISGRSLVPAATGETDGEPPPTYFEALSGQLNRGWAPLYGVVRRGWKFIDLPIPELYALPDDPREERNLAAARSREVEQLRALLASLRSADAGAVPSPETDEVRRRLLTLGYLSRSAPALAVPYTEADDPKRLIGLDALYREVASHYAAGDLAAALERSRELVRRRPGMRVALLDLAHLERESGDLEAAIEALHEAWTLYPEDTAATALLAGYLTQAGRERDAVRLTEPYVRQEHPDPEVLLVRSLALARLRRPAEAFAALERAAALDPGQPMVPVHLGTVHLMFGQRQPARAAFERALELRPGLVAAHRSLGILAAEEGRAEEAVAHWRRAVAADAGELRRLLAFAGGLWSAGRREPARPLLELFVEIAPRDAWGAEIDRLRRLLAATDP